MEIKIDEGVIGKAKDPAKRPASREVASKTLNNYVGEIFKILHHAPTLTWIDHVPGLRKSTVTRTWAAITRRRMPMPSCGTTAAQISGPSTRMSCKSLIRWGG